MTPTQKTIFLAGAVALGFWLFRKKKSDEEIIDVPFEEITEHSQSLQAAAANAASGSPDVQRAYQDGTNSLYQPFSEGIKTNIIATSSQEKPKPYPYCNNVSGLGEKLSKDPLKNVCLI